MKNSILLFPFGAILVSLIAQWNPGIFTPLKTGIIPLLACVMFGMGMTLSVEDFKRVLKRPSVIGLGVLLQYLIMPFLAWCYAKILQLPLPIAAGLVLVGACPGGAASNVMCYLARGDVALSISMTACSTLLAIICTPFLTWFYLNTSIAVPVELMMISIFKIVILPVVSGLLLNHFLGDRLIKLKQLLPVFSMLAVVMIIGIIMALNHQQLQSLAIGVLLAVFLHNTSGLLLGYTISRTLGLNETECKTIAIEVGMQNSGLAVALAGKYFQAAAALPGAVFSIWHNLSGAMMASYWTRKQRGVQAK